MEKADDSPKTPTTTGRRFESARRLIYGNDPNRAATALKKSLSSIYKWKDKFPRSRVSSVAQTMGIDENKFIDETISDEDFEKWILDSVKGDALTTSKRLTLALTIKGISSEDFSKALNTGPNIIENWKISGIYREQIPAVAHYFKVEGWVFTDERLSEENFKKIILDPALVNKYRCDDLVNTPSPESNNSEPPSLHEINLNDSPPLGEASNNLIDGHKIPLPPSAFIPFHRTDCSPKDFINTLPYKQDPITGERLCVALAIKGIKLKKAAKFLNIPIDTIRIWQEKGIPDEYISFFADFLGVKREMLIDKNLAHKTFKNVIRESTTQIDEPWVGKVIEIERGPVLAGGMIMPEGGKDPLSVSQKDLDKRLSCGDSVSFFKSGAKKDVAIRVLQIPPLLRFAIMDNRYSLIQELAEQKILPGESWNYNKSPTCPILQSYIYNTFRRLEEEDSVENDENQKKIKIVHSNKKPNVAIFDTGLLDKMYMNLYAVFGERNKSKIGNPFWNLIGFCSLGETLSGIDYLSYFPKLPERAQYTRNLDELWYDSSLCFDPLFRKISKEEIKTWPRNIVDRIPTDVTDLDQIMYFIGSYLTPAIKQVMRRIQWDYKTAIPRYSFQHKCIELMLPLCINDIKQIDCVLAVRKEEKSYIPTAILSLKQAYNDARLIAPVRSDWLDINNLSE
jgi:transposase